MDFTILEQLEFITLSIGIAAAISAPLLGWIRSKIKCIEEIKDEQEKQDERSLRQSKALIVLGHRMDDINFDQHSKKLNLGPEMETILKDEKGDL